MSTTTTPSATSLSHWIQPSPIWKDAKDLVSKPDGVKTVIEAVINAYDWMAHLGYNREFAEQVSSQLDPIKKTFAIPAFVESLGTMRDKWNILMCTRDDDALSNFTQSAASATFNLSESALALDAWGIYPLKQSLKAVKTSFWGAIALIEGIDFKKELENLRFQHRALERLPESKSELKNLQEHRIRLSYLNVLKATSTIAMAAIALTSLLFASLAHGFLFSPTVFLTLTSAWLILTYTTYFYGKMIERWENAKYPLKAV